MPQPPPQPPPPTAGTDNKRLCDYCYTATAVLYCRADTAILCLSCDREVHSTNQLFSKHTRSQLCDSCDAAPASIFCETEQSVFCQNCDWEKHSVNGCLVHTRRPFEGFSGCPSVSELMGVLGVEDLGYYNSKKGLVCTEEGNDDWMDGYEDLLDWKTPAAVSIDDLMSGHESYDHGTLNFQSLGVPSLPKNRNAVCGQHKELVLLQLRELSRSELNTDIESDTVPSHMFHSLDAAQGLHPKYMDAVCGIPVTKEEENLLQWFPDPDDDSNQAFVASLLPDSDLGKSSTTPDKQSNVNGSTNQTVDVQGTELDHTVRVRSSSALPKISSHELNSQERDSAISRYKEKRKTRRYDKHIRYESRKVRAESRIRVRGRFAKMDH